MILTEVKKIKVALSELQRCIPGKMETFATAKLYQCRELLPINSLDELQIYDSYIENGTDFKADYVRSDLTSISYCVDLYRFYYFCRWTIC